MSGWKKLASAAAATGGGLNVEDVFSTYLYNGTGYPNYQTITNGIDLAAEGGLIWTKGRTISTGHHLVDTERGVGKSLETNTANAEQSKPEGVVNFYNDGYRVYYENEVNSSGKDFASWTFRKAPKFFDVVTYTGNSTAGRTVSHNLGSVPAMIIIKRLDLATNWAVYHRSMGDGVGGGADENYYMQLNNTNARNASSAWWNNTAPTSTEFTLGNGSNVNGVGSPFVAYLFAHNDGDGEFGPTGDQDIIKCGSFTTSSSWGLADVVLGWEPQWVLYKSTSNSDDWSVLDVSRGAGSHGQWNGADNSTEYSRLSVSDDAELMPNKPDAESLQGKISVHPTGFSVPLGFANRNYIYIAIRRGPMAIPESASEVFDVGYRNQDGDGSSPGFTSGWPVDMALRRPVNLTRSTEVVSRLNTGKYLLTASTASEATTAEFVFDYQDGWFDLGSTNTNDYSWMWRRAPSFFDVVAYRGNGVSGHTIYHNLGVPPEMVWIKNREGAADWTVYHSDQTGYASINSSVAFNTTPILDNVGATSFDLLYSSTLTNTNQSYIAYLFASLAGVSKVGSYTGNGSSQTIDCGFSSGARFVLVKRADATGNWMVMDSERGIVTGDEGVLFLDSTLAEQTGDWIDPASNGFIINDVGTGFNENGSTYIFYAIA